MLEPPEGLQDRPSLKKTPQNPLGISSIQHICKQECQT